jgi:putative endonuclease
VGELVIAAHIVFGQRGEDLAAEWYKRRGYTIVARNWRCPIGEIDLVMRRGRLLVVAEVKARKSDAFGVPALAVTPLKQQRLRRLAAVWLAEHRVGRRVDVRFDVVAITGDAVDVYENAF